MKSSLLVVMAAASAAVFCRAETVRVSDAPFAMPELTVPAFPNRTFNVADYGAKPDGTPCTKAFAQAIAACAAAGGGRVTVPDGKWTTGAIHLKSGVDLHLSDGAVLDFTDDPADYLPAVPSTWEGVECLGYSPLVYAYGCTNVAITGGGMLAPRMDFWRKWFDRGAQGDVVMKILYKWCCEGTPLAERRVTEIPDNKMRPQLLQFNRSANILLDGFRIRESPFWTIHLFKSENAVVRNLDVYAHGSNNDGIDLEMSRNVLVEKCRFDQGDDGFVFKSGRNHDAWRWGLPTENVVVRNCHVQFAHSLLGVGSELSGGVRNVLVENCTVGKVYRLHYVKTNHRRGAFVDNITLRNVKTDDVDYVMAVETDILYQWRKVPTIETRYTKISNLRIENVDCAKAKHGVSLWGDSHEPIRGVEIKNVRIGTISGELIESANVTGVKIDGFAADTVLQTKSGSQHRGH